jgi:hypothetical protein
VGADGHVSSCLGGLSEKIKSIFGGNSCVVCFFCGFMCVNLLSLAFCGGLTGQVFSVLEFVYGAVSGILKSEFHVILMPCKLEL